MEENTIRIFRRMLSFMDDYRNHKIDLRRLVNSLEGSKNSVEEFLSEEFCSGWHKHWNKLEIILALGRENDVETIIMEIKSLEMHIKNAING